MKFFNSFYFQLQQKDREKTSLKSDIKDLQQQLQSEEDSKAAVERSFKQERTANSALRRQLAYFEAQQKAAERAKEESKQARKKLTQLQNMEKVIQGTVDRLNLEC